MTWLLELNKNIPNNFFDISPTYNLCIFNRYCIKCPVQFYLQTSYWQRFSGGESSQNLHGALAALFHRSHDGQTCRVHQSED